MRRLWIRIRSLLRRIARLVLPAPVLRCIRRALFGADRTGRQLHLPVPTGQDLGVAPDRRLPVMMVLLLDLPGEEVPGVVEAVAERQIETGAFAPLFVTDHDQLDAFRRFGFRVEHVMHRDDFNELPDPEPWPMDWTEYLEQRIAHLWNLYHPTEVVSILGSDPDLWRAGGALGVSSRPWVDTSQ